MNPTSKAGRCACSLAGGNAEHNEGIHAHMNANADVYYVAEDDGRQNISWIKSISSDGKETVYTSPDSKYKDQVPPENIIRRMDYLDCHNRPTHHFFPPNQLVNNAFNLGKIKEDIPDKIKNHGTSLGDLYG